jgi:hypothetical protein
MGLGLSVSSGDFIPFCKFDARAGRWFRKGENGDVDITDGFTAAFDFEQIEVGWMAFTAGTAPAYVTQNIALGVPAKPAGDNWKQGFRCNIALGTAQGGGVYELSSTAKALIGVIDRMHTEYSEAPEKSQGKLPVLKMSGTSVIETKGPNGTTRNYAPNLSIMAWVDRPASLAKKGAAPVAPIVAAPPATGSTVVPPPVAKPAPAPADMAFG